MIIIEIIPDCAGDPIRLASIPSTSKAGLALVVIGNNEAVGESPTYRLEIPCRKATLNSIANLYKTHGLPHGEGGSHTLAENRDAFCIHGEACPLRSLTVEELLFPVFGYQLNPSQISTNAHWQYQ